MMGRITDVESYIKVAGSEGAGAGIHLLLATQRPSTMSSLVSLKQLPNANRVPSRVVMTPRQSWMQTGPRTSWPW